MNVLLAPHGTRGDVQPMVALGGALRRRGHGVRFVAPSNFVGWLRASGFEVEPDGIDVEQVLTTAGTNLASASWQMQHLRTLVPALFKSVADASDGVDVIVGAGVQIAAASVAEWRDIAHTSAVFCPCAVPSSAAPPPTVRTQTLPPFLNRLLWHLGRPIANFALRGPINAGRAMLGLPPTDEPATQLGRGPILLACDPDLAPPPDDGPQSLVSTDAWIVDSPDAFDTDVDAFLALEPAPIYFGFGSMVTPDRRALSEAAIAAARAVSRPAIVAGGWASLDQFIGRADDVLAVRSVPHDRVLPRVSLAVHHGGAGTTTAVARAGVPQVVLPHILDQFYWARRVEQLGIGPHPLPVDLVNADVLTDRIAIALGDPRMAATAARLGAAVGARNGVDAAVDSLEQLVRT